MKIMIVYYSRSGITRQCAQLMQQLIDERGGHEVVLEELVDRKKRGGMFGWLGAGKDAATKVDAVIDELKQSAGEYDLVVIGTPVWAFTMASAVRTFCGRFGQDCARVAFYCTMGGSGDSKTFTDMENLLGKRPCATVSLVDKKVKKQDPDKYTTKVRQFVDELLQ
ncbi:MAG: flavodoxin family protein [Planctomycetota bacterium]